MKVFAAVKTQNSSKMNLRIASPIRYVSAMETCRNILASKKNTQPKRIKANRFERALFKALFIKAQKR